MAAAWVAIALLALVTLGGVSWWVMRDGELIAPMPIGLATVGLYVIPRAAYLLAFDRAPLTSAGLTQARQVGLIAATVLAAFVGVLGLLAGHRARWAIRTGTRLRFTVPASDPTRVLWVGGAAAFVGVLVLIYLFASLGNLGYALRHQYEVNVILEGKQWLFQLARLVVVAVLLLLVEPMSGNSRPWVWVFAFAAALAFVPFGYRALVVLAVGSPVALYHLAVRRLSTRSMVIGALLAASALFTMGFVRLLSTRGVERALSALSKRPVTAVHFAFNAVGEFKTFDAASIVIRDVPEVMPYNYGETFFRVPWMIVPRRLWPEKPVPSGYIIVQRYLPNLQTAYPPMAVGELFAAGGWIAVFVGFFGLGWASRVVWEWHRRHPGPGNVSVYLLYCFFVFDFIRVGDPSRTMWFFLLGATMTAFAFAASASWPSAPNLPASPSSSPIPARV